ncbi:MAG: hypothetical protein WAO47_12050 [Caldicoprobacterales bacterium]|jgi:hypothetical protein|nr:hypothetical protein [Clostridiales bacterium]
MNENANSLRAMSVGEILDNTFKIYGRNFLSILVFSAVIGGVFSIINGLVSYQAMPMPMTNVSWTQLLENPDLAPEIDPNVFAEMMPKFLAFQGIMILLIAINGIFIKPFVQGGIINLTYNDIIDQRLTTGQGLTAALKKFWKLVLTSLSLIPYYIAVGIVLIIISVLFVVPLIFSGIAMSNDPTGGKIAGFILMLFITIAIMIILAILSNVFVTFTYHGTTIENIYGFSAIGRSFRLVGKKFWRVLGINLLIYLIVIIISMVLGFISGITSLLSPNPQLADFIVSFLITAFITPIIYIATTLLFIDIKARVEGIQEQIIV